MLSPVSPSVSQIWWYARVRGLSCFTSSPASAYICSCTGSPLYGQGEHMTLRFTSPQAASVVSCTSLMRWIVVLEVRLQHAVQLQALPRGDAQRGVADLVAQVELGQQLVAGELAAGDGRADHEAVELGLGRPVDAGLGPPLAVVLLVRAVVLEKLGAVLADELVAVAQLLGDRAAKVVARRLGDFDGAQLVGRRRFQTRRSLSLPNR